MAFASTDEDYVLVGHSLGGVLLRASIAALPDSVHRPRHLFLLGSPSRASRLAKSLSSNPIFRLFCGDCGQRLASDSAMAAIAPSSVPSTAIFGTCSLPALLDPFPGEVNDGVVAYSEIDAAWLTHKLPVHRLHSFLPFERTVVNAVLRVFGIPPHRSS
jgi:hypothetical protein